MAKDYIELDRLSIHDASKKELLAFASEKCGLEFNDGVGRDFIIQSVFDALEWDAYLADENATHVNITLAKTESLQYPYQGGVQGKMFQIKRGIPTEINIRQYNSMVDAQSAAFRIANVGKDNKLSEGGPAGTRIPVGGLDWSINGFINKGTDKKVEETKPKRRRKAKADSKPETNQADASKNETDKDAKVD